MNQKKRNLVETLPQIGHGGGRYCISSMNYVSVLKSCIFYVIASNAFR